MGEVFSDKCLRVCGGGRERGGRGGGRKGGGKGEERKGKERKGKERVKYIHRTCVYGMGVAVTVIVM